MMLMVSLASLATTLESAELIREGVKRFIMQHHNQSLGAISLSLVACYPEGSLAGEAVIKATNTVLYHTKKVAIAFVLLTLYSILDTQE
ncbi:MULTISPECIES: nucleotidyl cyclase domain-containing protein [Nostocales]|nr:hypothetical protein [Tolypothrix bouteillei]KAF3890391.1 hypothetical protein DA73_0400036800 [Tolypothrix bouteillei VB521301]